MYLVDFPHLKNAGRLRQCCLCLLLCVLYVWPVISHDAMQINSTRRFLTMLVYIPDCVITSKIPQSCLKVPFLPLLHTHAGFIVVHLNHVGRLIDAVLSIIIYSSPGFADPQVRMHALPPIVINEGLYRET